MPVVPSRPEYRPSNESEEARVVIHIGPNEHECIDLAVRGLGAAEELFVRAGALVHIVPASGCARERSCRLTVRAVGAARVRELLARYTCCLHRGRQCHPPEWLVAAVMARATWPLRALAGLCDAPMLRPNGTIMQSPGYDAATALYYAPAMAYPVIADTPSRDEARAALDDLCEVVCDFPFATAAARSAWVATVLTCFARESIDGPVPLVAIDGNLRGVGKSLLADLVGLICVGRSLARMPQTDADEETRKRITALAMSAERVVLIDNVTGPLGTGALDAALTAMEWTDRRLGVSHMVSLPLRIVWLATGNQIEIVGDTIRRTLAVRLESAHEQPEERTDFLRSDLRRWTLEHRSRLVAAALTVLRAHAAAGYPSPRLRAWGSYEAWTRVVRAAMVWAGYPDPGDCRCGDDRSNGEVSLATLLVDGVGLLDNDGRGVLASDLARAVMEDGRLAEMADALRMHPDVRRDGQITARQIGYLLRRHNKRAVGGRRLECREGRSAGGYRWTVRAIGAPPDADGADSAHAYGWAGVQSGRTPGSAP